MFEQGGDRPAFRVNVWDVIAVLLQTTANMFGSIAAMFVSLSHLSREHSAYVDDSVEFQMVTSQNIEMLGGE